MSRGQQAVAERLEKFKRQLRARRLKLTPQRCDIARAFFNADRHLNSEELYREARKINPRIGYATVYRTMRLLTECGMAAEQHFDETAALYETVEHDLHHDHLICERCGCIVEFASAEVERLQEVIARKLGFVISRHRMELFGICRDCREGKPAARRPHAGARGVHRV